MQKIQKYNNIVFSIFGTLGIGLFIVMIIVMLKELLPNRNDSGMISHIEAQKNLKKNVRTQKLSFDEPILIDSVKQIYLIPCNQINLKSPESIEAKMLYAASEPVASKYYSYRTMYGSCNNLIVYNRQSNEFNLVFNKRLFISQHQPFLSNEYDIVIMSVVNKDTDGDNQLGHEDLKSLYIYDLKNQNIDSLNFPDQSLINWSIQKTSLILSLGNDLNKNGKFNYTSEPRDLVLYDLINRKAQPLVKNDLKEKLQSIIDGKTL